MSLHLPTFLARLADPAIRTVLLCGCGGGFDFVHSLVLYPELKRLGKEVVIGSYSFGDPMEITGVAPVVFAEGEAVAKLVGAASVPASDYGPEVHVCSYLDQQYPETAPHFIYAYYARAFTVPTLSRFYNLLIRLHSIDAVILVDGGSDSLMVGDEEGLGDPVEDAVSVATVAGLHGLKFKVLISIGLGADRFNTVSDAASLRAVAELTAQGGFLGACSLEPTNPGFQFYKDCVAHVYQRQTFHSVASGAIISAVEGYYGDEEVPPLLQTRVKKGTCYLWPLMGMLWAFDVDTVAARSLIAGWICACETPFDCYIAIDLERANLGTRLRNIEQLPVHRMRRPGL